MLLWKYHLINDIMIIDFVQKKSAHYETIDYYEYTYWLLKNTDK